MDKLQQSWLINKDKWNLENLPKVFLNMIEDGQLKQWDMNIKVFGVKGFESSIRIEKNGGLTSNANTIISDKTEFKKFIKIYKKLRDALLIFENNKNKMKELYA